MELFCLRCRAPRQCTVFDGDPTKRLCSVCGWRSIALVAKGKACRHELGMFEDAARCGHCGVPIAETWPVRELPDEWDVRPVHVTAAHFFERPEVWCAIDRDVVVIVVFACGALLGPSEALRKSAAAPKDSAQGEGWWAE